MVQNSHAMSGKTENSDSMGLGGFRQQLASLTMLGGHVEDMTVKRLCACKLEMQQH